MALVSVVERNTAMEVSLSIDEAELSLKTRFAMKDAASADLLTDVSKTCFTTMIM